MSSISLEQLKEHAEECYSRVDDPTIVSFGMLRRFIEKQLNLNKGDLIEYDESLMKIQNDILISIAKKDAQTNINENKAVPLVTSDAIDRINNESVSESEDDDFEFYDPTEWNPPLPDPRKVGCPFYFYFESRLRKELKDRKYKSLFDFSNHTETKWQLMDDKRKKKYIKLSSKDKKRYLPEYIQWQKQYHDSKCAYGRSIQDYFDSPTPLLNHIDYYILFHWLSYTEAHPQALRQEMNKELSDQWNKLTVEEQYPFKIMAKEEKKWFIHEMKRQNPDWNEEEIRCVKIREIEKKTYRPPVFYYMYLKAPAMMSKYPALTRDEVLLKLWKIWNHSSDQKKARYEQISKEYAENGGDYMKKKGRPFDVYLMMNRVHERMKSPYADRKTLESGLYKHWTSLSSSLQEPYIIMFNDEMKLYNDFMSNKEEKLKMMNGRLKNARALKNNNRPALFYYLITKLDEEMLKNPEQDYQQLTEVFYKQWKQMNEDDKKEYEEMRKKYAVSDKGDVIVPIKRYRVKWFSLLHRRFIMIQKPELSPLQVTEEENRLFYKLTPSQQQPYEQLRLDTKQLYDDIIKDMPELQKENKKQLEVWRAPIFYYLKDNYDSVQEEEPNKSKTLIINSLYETWLTLSDDMKKDYIEESKNSCECKVYHRPHYDFMCYYAMWKPYVVSNKKSMSSKEIRELLQSEYNQLSSYDKRPYIEMNEKDKEFVKQCNQKKKEETSNNKKSVKRSRKDNYINEMVKRNKENEDYFSIKKKAEAQWKKLSEEEKSQYDDMIVEDTEESKKEDAILSSKMMRPQRHPSLVQRYLSASERLAFKNAHKEDPWKAMSAADKWFLSYYCSKDKLRYEEEQQIAKTGYLKRKKEIFNTFVEAKTVELYIRKAVKKQLNIQNNDINECWLKANSQCRAAAYLTMIYRLLKSEERASILMKAKQDEIDMNTEIQYIEEESMKFFNFLIKNQSQSDVWCSTIHIFDKWRNENENEAD